MLTFQFPGEGGSLLGQRGACPGLPLQGGPAHLPAGQPGLVRPKEGEEGGEGGAGREEEAGQESDFVAVRVPPHCFGQNLSFTNKLLFALINLETMMERGVKLLPHSGEAGGLLLPLLPPAAVAQEGAGVHGLEPLVTKLAQKLRSRKPGGKEPERPVIL